MQLTKSIETSKIKGVLKKGLFLTIALFLSPISLFNIKGLLSISLLALAYSIGYDYLFLYFIALVFSFNYPLILLSAGIVMLLELLNQLKLLRSFVVPIINSVLIGIYVYFMYYTYSLQNIYECILIFLLQYMLQLLYLELRTYFVQNFDRPLTNREKTIILSLFLLLCLNGVSFNEQVVLTIYYAIVLYATYHISLASGSFLSLFILFIFAFYPIGSLYDLMTMMFPLVIYTIHRPNRKLLFIFLFLLSNAWLPLFPNLLLTSHVMKLMLASLLFLVTPNIKKNSLEQRLSSSAIYENERQKINRKIQNFNDLFVQFMFSFKTTLTTTNTKTHIHRMYETVCKECPSKDQCFDRYNGNHRLIKLFMQGLVEKLPLNEMKYIQNYCLNAKQYKEQLKVENMLYNQEEKMNQEYDILKNNLYEQLMIVSSMLNEFQTQITNPYLNEEDYVFDLLKSYHFQIEYLHLENKTQNRSEVELGIRNITQKEIVDELLPLVNQGFHTTFTIKKQNYIKHQDYRHLVLENKPLSYIQHALSQSSKDPSYCGDSYRIFDQNNKTYFIISDGMGHGKNAYEESHFLVDIFERMIKSGINSKESIQTLNALLKIKNKSDMFTTLDLAIFDPYKNEMEFYKFGSMHSYILRDEMIIEVEGRTLPIGIMQEVEIKKEKYECCNGDYIIMLSDGIDEEEENQIIDFIRHNRSQPQVILSHFSQMIDDASNIDDVTLLIMKIEETTYNEV